MALEFEKLIGSLDTMAETAAWRRKQSRETVSDIVETLDQYADDWPTIQKALERTEEMADPKHTRSARPVSPRSPMNESIDAPQPPECATIIATDGSQIMPDRHAAHLYYLINVGGIVYHHGGETPHADEALQGSERAPEPFSNPELHYPADDQQAAEIVGTSSAVGVERDLREIQTLAEKAWQHRSSDAPLLAMLDQRLLYWPVSGQDSGANGPTIQWMAAMRKTRDAGAALAGYIDRPLTSAVVTLLVSIAALEDPHFDWKSLGKSGPAGGLTDAALFGRILGPGQRSIVFAGVSQRNEEFARHDANNEVCFFYLNPGQTDGRIARIDIPMWVAKDEEATSFVHALIVDQCRILGDYPYVLARADEMAVIGRRDHEELDFMIDLYMQRHGVEGRLTAKLGSKELARGGRMRHTGL